MRKQIEVEGTDSGDEMNDGNNDAVLLLFLLIMILL